MDDIHELAVELRPVLTRLIRKMRKLAPADDLLSQSERAVLVLLHLHGELLAAELAVMEKMTPQSMGQLLNRLDKFDFLAKRQSPDDKRKILISLSEAGVRRIQKVQEDRNEWLSRAIGQTCNAAEQRQLRDIVGVLNKLIDFD